MSGLCKHDWPWMLAYMRLGVSLAPAVPP